MHTFVAETALRIVLSLVVLLLLVSCGKKYDEVKQQRIKDVNRSDTIKIAVIWDKQVKDFLLVEGVKQAADEINAQGGLFGRKFKIKVYYSKNDAHEQILAKKVAKDPSIAAVIGHRSSTNAIPASISYEYDGLLFVAPSSSNINLTSHGFDHVFRTISSDRYVSEEIAVFMRMQGHKNIAIVDDRSVYGKGLADGVMESFADIGLNTVVRRHYTPGKTDFKPLCAELARYDFDAIFIGGTLPYAANFIRVARQMGIMQRVYGGTALDSGDLEKIAGDAAIGTVVPTSFNPDLNNPLTREFVSNFKKRYKVLPDTRAALGYDSLYIIYEAMKRSKSAEPSLVASHMRFIKNWQGVTGSYSFNLEGDLVDKESYFKYFNHGRFVYFDDYSAQLQ
jgi:ABC-type branched-subunit amino acid transport system substrate-binding protein